jgi:putative transposase
LVDAAGPIRCFWSLKIERTARETYCRRDEAKVSVFDYGERFYNAKRWYSRIGYRCPVEFEMLAGLA